MVVYLSAKLSFFLFYEATLSIILCEEFDNLLKIKSDIIYTFLSKY